ncbi:MAG: hypothetical protein HXX09_12685, partial [Bacteroidetes bacterium]|nr:hypothetical protein [Bacteroidota bacterium]
MKRSIIFLLLIAFSSPIVLFSQKTAIYNNPDLEYKNALELFNKEKFGAAQKSFINTMNLISDTQSEMRIKAEYYSAICAIQLFNGDAEQLLLQFARNHSESPEIKKVYFELGKFQYAKKEYEKVVKSFEKIDALDLNDEEKSEYFFKLGYSNYMTKSLENAKKAFYEIYEKESKYSAPANYYYGHIAYSEKNYETALKCFLKLTKDESFG